MEYGILVNVSQEADSLDDVRSALERTLGCGSARIELRYAVELDFGGLGPDRSPASGVKLLDRAQRAARRQAERLFWWGVGRVMGRMSRKLKTLRTLGVIDFGAQRCMYHDEGQAEATLVVGDQRWEGPPGSAVGALAAKPASAMQPLWLLDLVRGVREAHPRGEEVIGGHPCRRFAANADLTHAAAAAGYDMALPSGVDRLGDLERIALELWVDPDGHLRRIRHQASPDVSSTTTLDLNLSELGIPLPSDWSHLQRCRQRPSSRR